MLALFMTRESLARVTCLLPIDPPVAQTSSAPPCTSLRALFSSSSESHVGERQLFHTGSIPSEKVNMKAKQAPGRGGRTVWRLDSTQPTAAAQTTPRIGTLPAFSSASELHQVNVEIWRLEMVWRLYVELNKHARALSEDEGGRG